MKNLPIALAILSLSIIGCSKKNGPDSSTKETKVYVAGREGGGVAIWHEGTQLLFEGTYLWTGQTYGVTIKDTNFYVAGSLDNNAAYWLNGESVKLTTGGSQTAWARSIFISGNDMYAAGGFSDMNGNSAGYWKNGVFVPLLTIQIMGAECTDIAVVNNVVHAVGTVDARAVYWKGTDTTVLSVPGYGTANAMKVVGNDVYVTGINVYNGALWKNGVEMTLEGESAYPQDVDVSGSDVYAAGDTFEGSTPIAAYWKNGKLTKLEKGRATGITVVDGDVYISGYVDNEEGGTNAVYWKNGVKYLAGVSSSGPGLYVTTTGIGVLKT